MIEKTQGIVLDIRKHNDRHNVVTMFTRSRGRVAFLSSAGGGRQARMRQALLQPLAVIEAEVNYKETSELQMLGQFVPMLIPDTLYYHPVKSAIVMFTAEFLNRLLRTYPPDESLWDFLADSIALLDVTREGTANFHLALLISLLPYAGIQPDLHSAGEGDWFDMSEGCFTPSRPTHRHLLNPDDAARVTLICRLNFANFTRFKFSGEQRRRILGVLLDYYALHMPGLNGLRSPDVLAEVFK